MVVPDGVLASNSDGIMLMRMLLRLPVLCPDPTVVATCVSLYPSIIGNLISADFALV